MNNDSHQTIQGELEQLLCDTFHVDFVSYPVDENTPIFEGGLSLDSVEAMELVDVIERTFGIQVPDTHLRFEHFRTIGAIKCLLESLGVSDAAHPR